MDLAAYFDRIGFTGDARPDLATLKALHRAHLLAIPYENLDVQLGRPVTPDPAAAVEKIVGRRRGGWCYEMNGVLGEALTAIGFDVTRLAGGVMRQVVGDVQVGNHLVLLVRLPEGPWIADVGFGDGSPDPFPLAAAPLSADGFDFRLEDLGDGWWRFHNHAQGGAPTYDFQLTPAPPAKLVERCQWLQSAPESNFVLNAVVQRWRPGGLLLQMRGRSLREVRPGGVETRLVGSADEYVAVLAERFGLDLPEAAGLWPRICARHEALFGVSA
ncbi:arylamine N-acetyltransferase [Phenylobacterium sp. J367]|uniref:arylamine N-acetyltransferase family protein n=1 Tax=Phenylobacterium sp. J367 TaxID=2898435 RepID=UPI002150AC32|nr:arylamine N-acetyltransferase [Phenylobacterium sp. J367]MCR5880898.1 arylamine N-acetyltransferase [Phenylobacterium sp. J367]